MRQHAPSATAAQEIKDGVEDLAAVMFEGRSRLQGWGNNGSKRRHSRSLTSLGYCLRSLMLYSL